MLHDADDAFAIVWKHSMDDSIHRAGAADDSRRRVRDRSRSRSDFYRAALLIVS